MSKISVSGIRFSFSSFITLLVTLSQAACDSGSSSVTDFSTTQQEERKSEVLAPSESSRTFVFLEGFPAFNRITDDAVFAIVNLNNDGVSRLDTYRYELSVTRGNEEVRDLFTWAKIDGTSGAVSMDKLIQSGEAVRESLSADRLHRTVVFARQPDDADVGEHSIRATITDVADGDTGNILASVSQDYKVMIENVYEPPRLVARPSAPILDNVIIKGERSVTLPSDATFEWDEWNLPPAVVANYTLRARYRAHIEPLAGGRAEVLLATRPGIDIEERGLLRGRGLSGLGVQNQSAEWTDYYVELVRAGNQASLPSDVRLFASDYNEGSRHNVTVSIIATRPSISSEEVEFDLGGESASSVLPLYAANYLEDYDRANVSLAMDAGIINRESLVQPGIVSQARNQINLTVGTPDLFTTNGLSFLSQYFSVSAMNPVVAYAEDLSVLEPPQIGETYGVYVDNEALQTIPLARLGESGGTVSLPIWIGDRQVEKGYSLEVAHCSEQGSNCGEMRERLIRVDNIERLEDAPTLVNWRAQAVAGQSQIELLLVVNDRDALEFSSRRAGLSGAFVPATEKVSSISINATDPCVFDIQEKGLTREGLDAGTQMLGLRLEATAGSASGTCAMNDLVEGVYSVALDGRLNVTLVDHANNDALVANTGSIADFGDSVLLNYFNADQAGSLLAPSSQSYRFFENVSALSNVFGDDFFMVMDPNFAEGGPVDIYLYNLSVTRGGEMGEAIDDLFVWAAVDEDGQVRENSQIASGVPVVERSLSGGLDRTVVFARQPNDADVGEYRIRAAITDIFGNDTGNILASVSQNYSVMIENVYEPPRRVAGPSATIFDNATVIGGRSVVLLSDAVFEWDEWNLPPEVADTSTYTLRARYRAHIEPLEGGRAEVLLATRPDTGIEERGLLRGGGLSGLGAQNQSAGWTDYYVDLVRAGDRTSLPSDVRLFISDYNEGSRHNVTVSVIATRPGVSPEAVEFDLANGLASTDLLLYKAAYPENYDRANVSLATDAGIMNRESLVEPGIAPQARNQINLMVDTPDLFTTNGVSSLSQYFSVSAMDPAVAYADDLSVLEAPQIGETYGVYVDNEALRAISLTQLGESSGMVSLPIWIGDRQVNQGYSLEVAHCSELGTNCGERREALIGVNSIERLDDAPTLVDWQAQVVAGQSQIELLLNVSDRDALEFSSGRAGLAGSFVPATEEASSIRINATDPCVFDVQGRELTRESLHAETQTLGLRLEAAASSASGTCATDGLVEGVYSVALEGRLNVTLVDDATNDELVANTGSIADFGEPRLLSYVVENIIGRVTLPPSFFQTYKLLETETELSDVFEGEVFTITGFVRGAPPERFQYDLLVTGGGEENKVIEDLFVWARVDEDGLVQEGSKIEAGTPVTESSSTENLVRTIVLAREPDDADVGEYRIKATIKYFGSDGAITAASRYYSVVIENVFELPRVLPPYSNRYIAPTNLILNINGEMSNALPSDVVFEWDEWNLPPEMASAYSLGAIYTVLTPVRDAVVIPLDEILRVTTPDTSVTERGLLRGGDLSGIGEHPLYPDPDRATQFRGPWVNYEIDLERAGNRSSLPGDIRLFASDYNEGSSHIVRVTLVPSGPGAPAAPVEFNPYLVDPLNNRDIVHIEIYRADYEDNFDRAEISLAADAGLMNRESLVQPGVMPQARNHINFRVDTPDRFTQSRNISLSQYFTVSAVDPAVAYADNLSALEAMQIGETYGVYVDNNRTLGDISLANSAATGGIVSLPIWIGDRQVNKGYELEIARCSEPGNCQDRAPLVQVDSIERLDDPAHLVSLFEINDGIATINASVDAQSARLAGELDVSFAVRDLDALETVDPTTGVARDNVVLKGVFAGEMSLEDNVLFPPLPCSFDENSFQAAQTAVLTDASRELTLRARAPLCYNEMLPPDNDGLGREYFLHFSDNSELRVAIETTDGSRPAYVQNIPTDTIRDIPNLLQPFLYFRDDSPIFYAETVNVSSIPRVLGNVLSSIPFASDMPITSSWANHSRMLSLDDKVPYFINDTDPGISVFPGQVWDLFIKGEGEQYSEVPPAEIFNSYEFRPAGRVLFEGIAPPRLPDGTTNYVLKDSIDDVLFKYITEGVRQGQSNDTTELDAAATEQYAAYSVYVWLSAPDEPNLRKRGTGSYYFVAAANNATHFIRFTPQVMSVVDHSFLIERPPSQEEINVSLQVCDFPVDALSYNSTFFQMEDLFDDYRIGGGIDCKGGDIPVGFLQDGELMENRLVGLLPPDEGAPLDNPPLVQLSDLFIKADDLPSLIGTDDIDAIRVPLNVTLNLRNDLLPPADDGGPKDYLINILLTDKSGSVSYSGFVVRITSLHPEPPP